MISSLYFQFGSLAIAGKYHAMAGDHERQRKPARRSGPYCCPFRNTQGENQVVPKCPSAAVHILRSPQVSGIHVHLQDKDFRGWLAHFIWVTKTLLLREREIDRILEELAGRSLSEPLDRIRDPALLQFIESEPVVAIMLEFMHTKDRHEATMETLWKELKKFARGRRLLVRGKNHFPGGPNVLSRKLAPLIPIFERLGITIKIVRSNGCKVTLTRRLDDSAQEPSAESLAPKSSSNEGLSPKDDKTERILRLMKRKNPGSRSPDD